MTNTKLAVESFGPKGGLLTSLSRAPEGIEKVRLDVKVEAILMYTVGGYVSLSLAVIAGLTPDESVFRVHSGHAFDTSETRGSRMVLGACEAHSRYARSVQNQAKPGRCQTGAREHPPRNRRNTSELI